MNKLSILLLATILLSGCARSYHVINPAVVYYQNTKNLKEGVTISYQYDEQQNAGNKRYSKKEKANHMAVVSVSITNKSNDTLVLDAANFQVVASNGNSVPYVGITDYTTVVKQNIPIYLLYGLGGIVYTKTEKRGEPTTQEITYNPIPLVVGVGNSIFAYAANKNQEKNLQQYTIFNKPILPGANLYGLMLLNVFGFPELNFYYYK